MVISELLETLLTAILAVVATGTGLLVEFFGALATAFGVVGL